MNQTVFEVHGEELIARAGMKKAEFARRMGIQRQNVKALFRSPKLETIQRVADVLDLPLAYLIGYVKPIDFDEEPFASVIREDQRRAEADMMDDTTRVALQLNAILQNAVVEVESEVKRVSKSQKKFSKMLLMKCALPGLGQVKLTVGVKQDDNSKVQYCITAIEPAIPDAKTKQSR